jgi:hypothetical protein
MLILFVRLFIKKRESFIRAKGHDNVNFLIETL